MRLLVVVDGFAHHTHIHPYEGICGRQLVPFLAFSFVLLLLLSSGYRSVTGSITFFSLLSEKQVVLWRGRGNKAGKATPSSELGALLRDVGNQPWIFIRGHWWHWILVYVGAHVGTIYPRMVAATATATSARASERRSYIGRYLVLRDEPYTSASLPDHKQSRAEQNRDAAGN